MSLYIFLASLYFFPINLAFNLITYLKKKKTVMSQTMPTQMSGYHVLLTGANGFVASHILSILLDVSGLLWYCS
jgi:hypothetical protein